MYNSNSIKSFNEIISMAETLYKEGKLNDAIDLIISDVIFKIELKNIIANELDRIPWGNFSAKLLTLLILDSFEKGDKPTDTSLLEALKNTKLVIENVNSYYNKHSNNSEIFKDFSLPLAEKPALSCIEIIKRLLISENIDIQDNCNTNTSIEETQNDSNSQIYDLFINLYKNEKEASEFLSKTYNKEIIVRNRTIDPRVPHMDIFGKLNKEEIEKINKFISDIFHKKYSRVCSTNFITNFGLFGINATVKKSDIKYKKDKEKYKGMKF